MEQHIRRLRLSHVANVRDLGGYEADGGVIRWNRLYRAGICPGRTRAIGNGLRRRESGRSWICAALRNCGEAGPAAPGDSWYTCRSRRRKSTWNIRRIWRGWRFLKVCGRAM